MSNYRKFSKDELNSYKQAGQKRAECERNLLLLMFDGFSNLRMDKDKYSYACLINEHCLLEDYTLIGADLDPDYSSLTAEGKTYFHVLVALDSLVLNGLVERKILFSSDYSPEDGYVNLDDKLDGTDAQYRSWLARSLMVGIKNKSFSYPHYLLSANEYPATYTLEYIEYQLITKGFDVALKFQEHNDQKARFSQQTELTDKAVRASTSSAKTAQIALFAAGAIAIGSLGNLVFSFLKHFCVI
jgi:hypothetical protein